MVKLQPVSAKIGEVRFRQKTISQLKGKQAFFPNYLKAREIFKYLKKKSQSSFQVFLKLKKDSILASPFVDIGAGICHRTAVLTNKFNYSGIALDISAESLESAAYFCPKIGHPKLPWRICADAENLPFPNNSFPFVLILETLHHFPDPQLAIKEAYRILAPGGYFYIGEEPIRRLFHFSLWRRDGYHLRWWEKILKGIIILHYISTPGRAEVSHGILENTFSPSVWEATLGQFEKVKAELIPFPFGPKALISKKSKTGWFKAPFLTRLIINLNGGGINALCQKKGHLKIKKSANIDSLVACPKCKKSLQKENKFYYCQNCQDSYPIKKKIIYLLSKNLRRKLYPDI